MEQKDQTRKFNPILPGEIRYLSYDEVRRVTGRSRSTIYRLLKKGTFPRARKISPRRVAFLQSEVEQWMTSRPLA